MEERMKLNSKFNILCVISSLFLIVNYLCAEKTTITTVMLIISLLAVIGYCVYENMHSFKELESNMATLDRAAGLTNTAYMGVKLDVDKLATNSNTEQEKVDEISRALENTSMMVIRNKENTRQASQLTQDVIKAVQIGNQEMAEMLVSISDIKSHVPRCGHSSNGLRRYELLPSMFNS